MSCNRRLKHNDERSYVMSLAFSNAIISKKLMGKKRENGFHSGSSAGPELLSEEIIV